MDDEMAEAFALLEEKLLRRQREERVGIIAALLDLHQLLIGAGFHTREAAIARLRAHIGELKSGGSIPAAVPFLDGLAVGLEQDALWMADALEFPEGSA